MTKAMCAGMVLCSAAAAEPPLFDGELVPSAQFHQAIGIDIDGDGQEDVMCPSGGLVVHLSGADGRPLPAVITPVPSTIRELAAADFTGDGVADAAYTRAMGKGVIIHEGFGDGTFGDGMLVPLEGAYGLAAVDADLDGDADLAAGVDDGVVILMNDGQGGFTIGDQIDVGSLVYRIRAGDIDGDGVDDLGVLSTSDAISSLLGDGVGGFELATTHLIDVWSPDFTFSDTNEDGLQDAVVARFGGDVLGSLDVHFGTENGLADPLTSPLISESGVAITSLDADGDGHVDVIVSGLQILELLQGDGAGGFETSLFKTTTVFEPESGVTTIETNAGTVLALANGSDLEVRTRIDGVIGTDLLETSGEAHALAVGDVNGDGKPDILLAAGFNESTLRIYLQSGGAFDEPVEYVIPSNNRSHEIAIDDVTGDGAVDIVVAHDGSPGLSLLEGVPGGLPLPAIQVTEIIDATSISLADWDGDGDLDLVTYGDFFFYGWYYGPGVFINNAGTFEYGTFGLTSFPTAEFFGRARAVDYDHDGTLDLVAADRLQFMFGKDDGGLWISMDGVSVSGYGEDLEVADFNGDGLVDASMAGYGGVCMILNDGGGFSQVAPISDDERFSLVAADLDADEEVDLAATGEVFGSAEFEIFFNRNGGFESARFASSNESVVISDGDLDGDGDVDLVTATDPDSLAPAVMMIHENLLTCPADFNGDGVFNVLDFVDFQLAWLAKNPDADCNLDGDFSVLDFVCFQLLFVEGCN